MNGMTSTKRIFALLDALEPEHGSKELPEFGASGRGVGVEFRGVSYRYADADVDAGGAAGAGPDAAGSAGAGVASPRRISSTSHSDMRNADVDSVDEGGGAGDARETRYALRNVALRALPAKSLRSSGHPVPASPQPSSCLPARLSDMKAMCCCPKCHPECRTKCWALC